MSAGRSSRNMYARQRDLGERELAVGHADDAHRAVAELEVGLGHLELVARRCAGSCP